MNGAETRNRGLYTGDSMRGAFATGETLILAETAFETLRVGDVVAIFDRTPYYVHRIVEKNADCAVTMGDNNDCPDVLKLTPQKKKCRKAGSAEKKDLSRQNNAHKKGQAYFLGRGKTRSYNFRQPFRKEHTRHCCQKRTNRYPQKHTRKKTPGFLVTFPKCPAQKGDNGNRHKSPRQKIVDHIRHYKGCEIHIRFLPCPELPRNHLVADKSHKPRKKTADKKKNGCRAKPLF